MYRQQYGEDETYDDEYEYYYPPTPVDNKPEHVKAGFYTFLALLLAALSVGGLFLGLLGKVTELFASRSPLTDGGASVALSGSVIGVILAIFKGMFGMEGGASVAPVTLDQGLKGILPTALFYYHFVTATCVVLTLAFAIVSVIPQKSNGKNRLPRAGVCVFACGFLTVIGYGGLFLLNLWYYASDALVNSWNTFFSLMDLPLAVVAGVALLLLIVTALKNGARAKKAGFVFTNALLLVLSVVTAVMLAHPACPLFASFNDALAGAVENIGIRIVAIATYAITILNLIFSLFRINTRGLYVVAIVRFAVQSALIFTHALLLALLAELGASVFAGLPLLISLIASVVALLLSVLATIVAAKKKKRERQMQEEQASRVTYVEYAGGEEEADDEEDEEESDEEDEEEEETPYVRVNVPLHLAQQPAEQATAPVPPTITPTETAEPFGPYPQRGFQQNIYHQHIYQYPQPQQPVAQPEPQPEPQPVVQPEPQPQPEQPSQTIYQFITPQPESKEAPEPREKSQFELEMEALARGELKRKTEREKKPDEEEAGSRFPKREARNARQTAPQTAPPAVTYFDSQYTYDPFINSLTTPEKNEFCDIFIANKYGSLRYVPAYVIGGDNTDFFRKVFIYLGKFRANISDGLLDKMYYYVSQRN